MEPLSRSYVHGWHIDAICEHLEAITYGHLTRLLINVPPGFMKSLTTRVFWPAWEWGPRDMPWVRTVGASYSDALSIRDNLRCRRLILSELYRQLWGGRVQLTGDQAAKTRFEIEGTGSMVATSVSGLGTGERGDRFVIDDPHNVHQSESEAVRESTLRWFSETVPTRLNDPAKSAIVVIMQRVHERDVCGYALSRELGYEHLCLPMEFEPERRCETAIGFRDPRDIDGELLWPSRYTREDVDELKKALGSYAAAGQLQQRPAPREGGMFHRDWFEVVPAAPADARRVRAWDLAATKEKAGNNPAWTAGLRLARDQRGIFYIEDVRRLRGSSGEVERVLRTTASQDGEDVPISIPQDPGQAGKAQAEYLIRQLAGYNIRATPETGDKSQRAEPAAAQAEAGNVKLVRGKWNEDFLAEIEVFPSGQFLDQVDALSRAFQFLSPNRGEPRIRQL